MLSDEQWEKDSFIDNLTIVETKGINGFKTKALYSPKVSTTTQANVLTGLTGNYLRYHIKGLAGNYDTQGLYVIPLTRTGENIAEIVLGVEKFSIQTLQNFNTIKSGASIRDNQWHTVEFEMIVEQSLCRVAIDGEPWSDWFQTKVPLDDTGISKLRIVSYNGQGYWDDFLLEERSFSHDEIKAAFLSLPKVPRRVRPLSEPIPKPKGRNFDQPDLENLIRDIKVGDTTVLLFASKPAKTLYVPYRDRTVLTVGMTKINYFYPQNPTDSSVILHSETNYYDLDISQNITIPITGLKPNTTYYYRINDSEQLVRFRTRPRDSEKFEPFQFTVVGDSQGPYDAIGIKKINKEREGLSPFQNFNDVAQAKVNVTSMSMREKAQPDFSIHLGDFIEDARYTIQWTKEFFGPLKYYLMQAPVFPVMGNHEYHDPRFWSFFDLPISRKKNEPNKAFYSFDWGQAHFIVLDLNTGWATINDIDKVPDLFTYTISKSSLEYLSNKLSKDYLTPFREIESQKLSREAFNSQISKTNLTPIQSRYLRVLAINSANEGEDFYIVNRNPENGRVEYQEHMNSDLQEKQWRWYEEDLKRNYLKKYIFVFTHHNVRYGRSARKRVTDPAERYRVSAVFSGHLHLYAHSLVTNTHYFQAGGFSNTVFSALVKKLPATHIFHKYGPNYTTVNVDDENATIYGIDRDNQIFETTKIAARKKPR